jgi:hypothetical protein
MDITQKIIVGLSLSILVLFFLNMSPLSDPRVLGEFTRGIGASRVQPGAGSSSGCGPVKSDGCDGGFYITYRKDGCRYVVASKVCTESCLKLISPKPSGFCGGSQSEVPVNFFAKTVNGACIWEQSPSIPDLDRGLGRGCLQTTCVVGADGVARCV